MQSQSKSHLQSKYDELQTNLDRPSGCPVSRFGSFEKFRSLIFTKNKLFKISTAKYHLGATRACTRTR